MYNIIYNLGINTIKNLEVAEGVLASSKDEIFGCIFGRDSLLTALRLLSAYDIDHDSYHLHITKKIIQGLANLQGKEVNIESGEEPGKCIHEFRKEKHEHLTQQKERPWYLYPDGTMRNFDSLDATPLFLIATYRYWQKTKDDAFIQSIAEPITMALNWIAVYGDKNNDGFLDYQIHPQRTHGGLVVQSWMDSKESLFHEEAWEITFPIAPVESQAYAYLAFKLWAEYFKNHDALLSRTLYEKAISIKELFNKKFIISADPTLIMAFAIDGKGTPLISTRSSIGHILWASVNPIDDGQVDCILDQAHLSLLVKRLLKSDMFEPKAGIRTLSKQSKEFQPMSYHNGSIWPHDTSMIAEGMEKLGYEKEARRIRRAIFRAYTFFNTPVELFSFWENEYKPYQSYSGTPACQQQAWSAASMIIDSLHMKRYSKTKA